MTSPHRSSPRSSHTLDPDREHELDVELVTDLDVNGGAQRQGARGRHLAVPGVCHER